MRPPPLHVLAKTEQAARNFIVGDLRDDHRRLHYINTPDAFRGRSEWVLVIHPTADQHPHYREMIRLAQHQGNILLMVEDSYARRAYEREQDRQTKYPSILGKIP